MNNEQIKICITTKGPSKNILLPNPSSSFAWCGGLKFHFPNLPGQT